MTMPDVAAVGDPGHVTDHNLLRTEVLRLEADKLDIADATGTYVTVVEHGATAGTARPIGAALVLWVGTVNPTNAATDDLLQRTDTSALFRYDGAAWDALAGGGGSTVSVDADGTLIVDGTTVEMATDAQLTAHEGAADPHPGYLTAAEGNAAYRAAARELFAVKTADESVTSSTVLQDDDHLSFAVGAGETWVWECAVFCNGDSATDIQIAFSWPTGVGNWQAHGLDTTLTGNAGSTKHDGTGGSDLAIPFGINNSRQNGIFVKGYIAATTSGTVRLRWAQAVSSATATQVRIGSHLTARRVT